MIYLTILMAERVGLIIILAFLLVSVPLFRRLLFNQTISAKVQLIFLFAVFAVMANMTGIEVDAHNQLHNKIILTAISTNDSIVNARILAVSVAGIIGGPWVGSLVGVVAGVHRLIQGAPLQGWFYIPSSALIGALSGFLYHDRQSYFKVMTPWHGFIVGILMESIQMAFIFLFSPTGWNLVRYIGLPMILVNSLGTSIFLSIISMYLHQEEELRATQTHSVLQLTNETLPYFRQGLNKESAQQVVKIIKKYTNFAAVSITDRQRILAHVGAGNDHHIPGNRLETSLSSSVIETGQVKIANSSKMIGCVQPDCPLEAAIVAPLRIGNKVIGTLKMYYTDQWHLTPVEIQLAIGLCEIFSNQIALGEAEVQAQLVRDAKIKSLQAQINPHFFFNAINTISAILRRDQEKARTLLLQLSNYFRANLIGARETEITLAQERRQVDAYLELEQTRFPHKYNVSFDQQAAGNVYLPPFTIQVLVENSLKYAFGTRKDHNNVQITVKKVGERLEIQVLDNGNGIKADLLDKLGQKPLTSSKGNGNALYNLNQRLVGLYDEQSALQITSNDRGTKMKISLPYHIKEG